MTNKQEEIKNKTKKAAVWSLVAILGLFTTFGVVSAFSGSAQNVAEDGGVINVYNEITDGIGAVLGGGTRYPNGLSADSTSPEPGEVRGTSFNATATLGVVSSTPFGQLSVGAGGDVTSTISVGKFCMYAGQENGVDVYVYMSANLPAGSPFATTTVSCF